MNSTLFKYIFEKQLKAFLFVSLSVFCLIFLFDFVEVSRKFSMNNFSEIIFVLKLSTMRVPITFCEVAHYIYFITATFSLWDLCRSHQITILKSTGKSPQQILFPFITFSIFISFIWLFALQPFGISSENLYQENLSAVQNSGSKISRFKKNENIWINYPEKNQIIFIKSIQGNKISDFYLFNIPEKEKIFAEAGTIEKGVLSFENVVVLQKDNVKNLERSNISQNISSDLINLLSIPPNKQNVYNLYKVYKIQMSDHVNLRLYEIALQKLLANCACFILFSLIAAIICFPINRYKTKTNITFKIIAISLLIKFTNDILESLAYTGVISVFIATWSVILISLLLSTSILVWREF